MEYRYDKFLFNGEEIGEMAGIFIFCSVKKYNKSYYVCFTSIKYKSNYREFTPLAIMREIVKLLCFS